MQPIIFLSFIQSIIFYIFENLAPVNALIGELVHPVQTNQFPSVVCITKYSPGNPMNQNVICSGTLITNNHVLTAENCFYELGNNALQIVVGTGDVSTGVCTYPIWWISYNLWATYRGYPITMHLNNIALLKTIGMMPRIRLPVISPISPISLLEGFNVELYGCGQFENYNNMIQTVTTRVLQHQHCENIISQIEGVPMIVPPNYMCSVSTPYSHLEKTDMGGPMVFYDAIVGINIGLFPAHQPEFNPNQVNAHLGIDNYRAFLTDISGY